MQSPKIPKNRYGRTLPVTLTLMLVPLFLAAIPTASAMSVPVLGEIDPGFNLGFILLVLGSVAVLVAIPLTGAWLAGIPLVGAIGTGIGATFGVAMLLGATYVNPGGALHPGDDDAGATASFTTAAIGAAAVGGGYDPLRHMPTSKIVWSVADKATHEGTGLSATIKLYKPGVAEKDALENTVTPIATKTTTDGTGTLDPFQVQTHGCTVDALVDLANYYQQVFRNINVCAEKNTAGYNSVAPPTMEVEKYGTLALTITPASLTCTAGTQCSYTLVVQNTAANTFTRGVAVKFTNVDSATLDSADAGQGCRVTEDASTYYVEFDAILATGAASCNVKISRATGDTDGSFTWTANDNFQLFDATGWNTHTNIRGAAVTAAKSVSFA